MGKPTNQEICDALDRIESAHTDISTEKLFALTCDHFKGAINDGDIADALFERGMING